MEADWEEIHKEERAQVMGKTARGKRDGTGPYKNSHQRKSGGGGGRREQCYKGKKK